MFWGEEGQRRIVDTREGHLGIEGLSGEATGVRDDQSEKG